MSASEIWTTRRLLTWMEEYFTKRGVSSPRLSAQWLIAHCLGVSRIELYTDLDRPASLDERAQLREYTERRAAGEPLQYITGSTDFRYISVKTAPGVLIPRPETEVVVEHALSALDSFVQDHAHEDVQVLDLCTGSGIIALSLAHERPNTAVSASDISPEALSIARENAVMNDLNDRVNFFEGSLFDALRDAGVSPAHQFGLIVSNPPYIPTDELKALDHEVRDFEPMLALDGGADGNDLLRAILDEAPLWLSSGASIVLEAHEHRLEDLSEFAKNVMFNGQTAYDEIHIHADLVGKPRLLLARAGQHGIS